MSDDAMTVYQSQLNGLHCNSKPVINALTMLAEDNIFQAPAVMKTIEDHLLKVDHKVKLPVLYLIDSILKNVKKDYIVLFSDNIHTLFGHVFRKAEEKTRSALWKLRQTWNDIFPPNTLYTLDVMCNGIDHNWPLSKKPVVSTIHVNPKFLHRPQPTSTALEVPSNAGATQSAENNDFREELWRKEKELMELRQKKLELELVQAKVQLQAQQQITAEVVAQQGLPTDVLEPTLEKKAEIAKHRTGLAANIMMTVVDSKEQKERDGEIHIKTEKVVSASLQKDTKTGEPRVKNEDRTYKRIAHVPRSKSPQKSKSTEADNSSRTDNVVKSSNRNSPPVLPLSNIKLENASVNKKKQDVAKERDEPPSKKSKHDRESLSDRSKSHEKHKSRDLGHKETRDGREDKRKSKDRDVPKRLQGWESYLDKKGETTNDDFVDSSSWGKRSNSSSSPRGSSKDSRSSRDSPRKKENKRDNDSSLSLSKKQSSSSNVKRSSRHKDVERNSKSISSRISGDSIEKEKSKDKNHRESTSNRQIMSLKVYKERTSLQGRNYRKMKSSELEEEEDEDLESKKQSLRTSTLPAALGAGDTDLRFNSSKAVGDLRKGSGLLSNSLKAKCSRNDAIVDDLFGREDVDHRQPNFRSGGSNSWSQMKKSTGDMNDRIHMLPHSNQIHPPPSVSPASSIGSQRGSCDPLGRRLLFNRLPDDPAERKRSLVSRSSSIDPISQFRAKYIEPAVRPGRVDDSAFELAFHKAREEYEKRILTKDEFLTVLRELSQLHEVSKIKEVQQMQTNTRSWNEVTMPAPQDINPWTTDPKNGNFGKFGPGPRFQASDSMMWNAPSPWNSGPVGPNPFEEAMSVARDDFIPPANENQLKIIERDVNNVIPLDRIPRRVRFYGHTGITLLGTNSDDPRELFFQNDTRLRTIYINKRPIKCRIGETKCFELDRGQHTLKLGAPTRELYINDAHYTLCFGGPEIKIRLGGRVHTFLLEGEPPQVRIGEQSRFDLLAGQVNLIVDGVNNVPMFLDEKAQAFDLSGFPVILVFQNEFKIVTLNGRPYPTNFGARLPFSVTTPAGRQHFLRFSQLRPETMKGMELFINHRRNSSTFESGRGAFGRGRGRGRGGFMNAGRNQPFADMSLPVMTSQSSGSNPLEMLSTLFPTSEMTVKGADSSMHENSYESESTINNENEPAEKTASFVQDLVSKLMEHGLLNLSPKPPDTDEKQEISNDPIEKTDETNKDDANKQEENNSPDTEPVIPPLATVDVALTDNLKDRRQLVIDQICVGVQCGSCGLRFPPDQTVRYSQHLDWHFRFNRREKANTKKAQSRKWYFDLSDWVQFEEFEDLDERAASLFESQEPDVAGDIQSPHSAGPPEDCSVLAAGFEGVHCPQCGEEFESYFDEDKEEWRLKDAVFDTQDDDKKLFHYMCHRDYMKSLVEESTLEVEQEELMDTKEAKSQEEEEKPPVVDDDDDEVLVLKEGPKEIIVMEIDVDDDDDMDTSNVASQNVESNETVKNSEQNVVDHKILSVSNSFASNNISVVRSPIVIDDDSESFLPGLSDLPDDSVFGFALNSDRPRVQVSEEPEKRIIYESMKFDFPRIKVEPVDDIETEDIPIDGYLQSMAVLAKNMDNPSGCVDLEPEDIDLTVDDADESRDGSDNVMRIHIPSNKAIDIDGNQEEQEISAVSILPIKAKSKVLINISNLDLEPTESEDAAQGSQPLANSAEGTSTTEEDAKIDVAEDQQINKSPSPNDESTVNETNKDVDNVPDKLEELKRLKPRLVGRKLVNCPTKHAGKEESALCTIC